MSGAALTEWGTQPDSTELESVKDIIRSLVIPFAKGCPFRALANDYEELEGQGIPFQKFGYGSLHSFLASIPDTVTLKEDREGKTLVHAVSHGTTQHIEQMVKSQRKRDRRGKKRKYKENIPPPRNFNPNWQPRPQQPSLRHPFQQLPYTSGRFGLQQPAQQPFGQPNISQAKVVPLNCGNVTQALAQLAFAQQVLAQATFAPGHINNPQSALAQPIAQPAANQPTFSRPFMGRSQRGSGRGRGRSNRHNQHRTSEVPHDGGINKWNWSRGHSRKPLEPLIEWPQPGEYPYPPAKKMKPAPKWLS